MSKADVLQHEREEPSGGGRRKKRIFVPFWINDGIAYEAVRLNGKSVFLWFDDEVRQFKTKERLIDKNGVIVMPEQANYLDYEFWAEPEHLSIPDLRDIYSKVEGLITNFFVHSDERIIKFLALYLIHSYVLTKSLGTVFMWLVGPKRSGKTTFQLLAERLGYRAISGINPSEAAIYRSLGSEVDYGPMILIHEYERASPFMRTIAREGDIPGVKVSRADTVGERIVVNYYYIYGSRIVASNKLHGDDIDLDRYFIIKTIRGRPRLPSSMLYRDPVTMDNLERLRRDLLLWKLASFKELNIPFSDPRNEIIDGRDWLHFGGIITLAAMISPELESEIRGLILEYIRDRDAEEAQFSLTELLRRIVVELCESSEFRFEGNYKIPFHEIWDKLKVECSPYIENGIEIPNKLIGPDGSIITQNRAGRILREQLLGKHQRWYEEKNGKTRLVKGYVWDVKALRSLKTTIQEETYDHMTDMTDFSNQKGGSNSVNEPSLHNKVTNNFANQNRSQSVTSVMEPSKESVTDMTDYDRFKDKNTDLEEKERRFHNEPPLPSTPPSNPEKSVTSVISVIYSHAEPGSSISPGGNNQLPPKEYVGALKPESSVLTESLPSAKEIPLARPALSEEELPERLRKLVFEGRLIREDGIGWRCRCGCGPYRAAWAIERHLQVCDEGREI